MKNKYVFEKEEKYTGNSARNLRKALIYFVTVIIAGVTLLLEGCFLEGKANAIEPEDTFNPASIVSVVPSSTPTATAVATSAPTQVPIATPSPTVTPEPTPSPTPIPYDEKVERMLAEEYEDSSARYANNQMLFFHFKSGEKESISFFGISILTDKSDGIQKTYMINRCDMNILFYYPKDIMSNYGPNGVDYFTDATPYAEGYVDKPFEVLHVGTISQFEEYLKSLGIDVPETKYSETMNNANYGGGFTSIEYAKYLAIVLPDELCVFHSDVMGINEYPTPTPKK